MICLSRLILDPRSRDVARDVADCHALHRTVMSGFPLTTGDAQPARERFGVLFRLEAALRDPGALALLVQSDVWPDWSRLRPGYLLETGGEKENPACKRIDDRYRTLGVGTVLRFRLRANPTRKVDTRSGPDGARRNGRRVDWRGEEERLAWLQRKGEQGGFRLLTVSGTSAVPSVVTWPGEMVAGSRPGGRFAATGADTRLTFASVLFDGTLVVADRDRFQETLALGVGPGKAYGFGLLSIARPLD